jgi:hypothetical protein
MTPSLADRWYWRDTFCEILALFTVRELAVVRLRLEAVSDDEIAGMLDITRQAVRERFNRAERRIVRHLPELAYFFRDRSMQPGPRAGRALPLEQGWLCTDPVALRDYYPIKPCYSPGQVAALCEMNVKVVQGWCRTGRLPGAHKRGGRWLIPEEDLEVAELEARRARRRERARERKPEELPQGAGG